MFTVTTLVFVRLDYGVQWHRRAGVEYVVECCSSACTAVFLMGCNLQTTAVPQLMRSFAPILQSPIYPQNP